MGEVVAAHVADREFAEHVVEDRGRVLDRVVALHGTRRLEAGEGEGVDILLQRHAVLQAERHRDREVVDEGAQRRAFLVHVDEDLAEPAVVVFAGAQVDFMSADDSLLGVALAAIRHLLALAHHHDALDQPLHHLLGHLRGARRHRLVEQGLQRLVVVLVVGDELGIERLRQLRAVAIERVGFQRELPRQQVGGLAVLHRGVVRHVDGLGDRARDEGLRRRHHADVAFDRQITLADLAARIGAVEHRVVLCLQVRCAFHRHRTADVDVGGLTLALAETDRGEQVEAGGGDRLRLDAERVADEVLAQRPLVEGELDVECGRQRLLDPGDGLVGEALGLQRADIDRRRVGQRAVAHRVSLDLGDLAFAIAERAQRFRHRAVDDLPVAAAGKLLELHQREIGLDAGGVAIHHQADGAGRRHHSGLRIAIAVLLAEVERAVPCQPGAGDKVGLRAACVIERHRIDRQRLIAGRIAVGGAAVIADHPQHVLGVLLVAGEGAELARHLGRGRVGHAGHDRGQRAAQRPAFLGIIGQPHGHQEAADVGEAESEGAEFVGQVGDLLRRELRHHHRYLEHHGPQPAQVLVGFDVEAAGGGVVERQQVGGGQVACRVVEEHVFRARIRGADVAGRLAGVPVVHRGVEVQARIGGSPCRVADLLPQLARLQRLRHLAGGAADQVPVAVGFHRAQEVVLQRHRVVGVLARNGEIGFRIPVGVVDREVDVLVALLRELDHALDVVIGHQRPAGELDLAAQRRVLLGQEAVVARALAVDAGAHHRLEVLLVDPGAGDEGGDLLLLAYLPVDVLLDVGMIDVDHHHLGGAARGAAALDGTGGAVADLEEAHQPGGAAAAGEALAFAAQAREVGAGAGAVFEQARLAHPQVHDAALVDEVVLDALDEAGVRLRVLIGRLRLGHLAGLEVDVVVALAGAVDAIGPVQAGVEPLRRVRRHHLPRQHVAKLIMEGAGVVLAGEVAALPAPIGPAAGQTVEHLLGGMLAAEPLGLGQGGERLGVRYRAPQP